MAKKFELREGHEIRGLMIRLYPDANTVLALKEIESFSRTVWNWLIKQTEDVLAARAAFAEREKLVPPRPPRLSSEAYAGLSPEESKALRIEQSRKYLEWCGLVRTATKNHPACSFRKLRELLDHYGAKHDYQLLKQVISWRCEREVETGIRGEDAALPKIGSSVLQALAKNYIQKSVRRKKFRRSSDVMPLQTRSGTCFVAGDFGSRGGTHSGYKGRPFFNCQISFNGLKIRGRLPGRAPWGRVLEGVSITHRADGWWASIKQEVPVRALPTPVAGTNIGLDVGLHHVVAFSDKVDVVRDGQRRKIDTVTNQRDIEFSERIAGRQAFATTIGDPEARARYENTTHRLQIRASRHMRHVLYNEVVKPLESFEVIKIEQLTSKIGQMGSTRVSAMRRVRMMLVERYGDRVREVDCRYTSQDCSQCGHRSKESWSYEHGRYGKCPECGYREDRDVNAARNIAAKEPLPLAL